MLLRFAATSTSTLGETLSSGEMRALATLAMAWHDLTSFTVAIRGVMILPFLGCICASTAFFMNKTRSLTSHPLYMRLTYQLMAPT